MATDHDFKIKNGAQIENGFLLIGKEALSSSDGYMGMKTSNMTGTSDYMIISGTGDNNTYISAKDGASVYIRGGGNSSGHQLQINSSQALFHGVVNLSSSSSLRVSGTTVLTSARNLTNIGTISSGAITGSDLIKTTSSKGFMLDSTVDMSMSYYNQVPSTSWAIFTTNNHADTILSTNLKVNGSHDIVVNQTHSTMKGSGIVFTGNGHSAGENAIAFYAFGDNDGGTAGDVINEEDWAAKLTGSGFEIDGTVTAPTLIAGAYGAGGSAGDGFRINSTDIYGQIDSVDKVHISAVTGHIGVQSGHSIGKFAIMSSGVHNNYDFYNNGTSYFNGNTTVDAILDITGSTASLRIGGTEVISTGRNLSNIHDLTLDGVVRSTNNANVDGPNFNVSTTNKDTAEYAYRVDRSGTVKGGITINGVFKSATGIDLTEDSAGYVNLNRGGFITFYGNSNSHHGIGSRDQSGAQSDDLRINTYAALHINLDSNNNNTSSANFTIGKHGGGTGTISNLFTVSGEDGTTTVPYVRITGTGDAALASTTHGLQIGSTSGNNVIIDDNEVMARSNGSAGTLYLQADGGTVSIGGGTAANLTVTGSLTVQGTTTTLNTANLNVEDKNITLNYSTGDSSASANGAGITIQDAVNSTTDATITWSQSGSNFNVSHGWNSLGYLQHSGYLYSRDNLAVLNSAGNGWNTWATRSNGQFNLSVGTITSGALSATGNSTITGSGSTSNALNVYRGSDGASAFRVLNTGEVLVSSHYFYVDASQGAYFNGNLRARGGISNDGSNYGGDVRILDNTDVHGVLKISSTTVIDSSRNLTNIGTITTTGKATIDNAVVADSLHIRGDAESGYTENSMVGGISLWGSVGQSTSQIMFKPTSAGSPALGNHGFCTDSYNTYFVMDTTNRGWVFRNATTDTNVASISNTGGAAFNNGIKIGTTTIVDSSRNLTNLNNVSAAGSYTTEGSNSSGYGTIRITNPKGADVYSRTSSQSGAIKITLPQSWTSTMMWFTIEIYEYASNESFTVKVGGYNYSSSSAWINQTATIISNGNKDRNFTVRFAHDGSKCCIFIGDLTSTWSYPQVAVTEFIAGFSNATVGNWHDGWDISFETSSYGTVSGTHTQTDSNIHHTNIKIGGTEVIDSSRNLTNIGAITTSGELKSTSTSGQAIKTRFIAGAANASTADGPLYLQYGKSQDIRMFEASGANRKLYIYGNDNGTDRWGGLSIASDGSFTVQASDTYLILQASSYIQSNNPHNFTSSLLTSGTVWLDSARNATFTSLNLSNSSDVFLKMTPSNSSADPVLQMNGNAGIASEGFEIWYDNTVGDVHLHTTYNDNDASIRFHTKTGASKGTSNERFRIDGSGYTQITSHTNSWDGGLRMVSADGTDTFKIHPDNNGYMYVDKNWYFTGAVSIGSIGQYAWHSGNDGSGSGLDADTVDGVHKTGFMQTGRTFSTSPDTINNGGDRYNPDSDNPSNDYYAILTYGNGGNVTGQFATHFQTGQSFTRAYNNSWSSWRKQWDQSNDGSGSGLDADTLDGINSGSFLRSDQSDSMSGELNVSRNGGVTGTSAPSYSDVNIELQTSSNHVPGISFHRGGYSATTLYEYDGELYVNAWTTRSQTGKLVSFGNDGSGSGLDADTLDGINSGSFLRSDTNDTMSGTLTFGSGSGFDLATFDIYGSMRVIRNNKSGSDGMYIGYLNSNSGLTRIFGGGQGSGGIYVTGSGANDIKYNNASTFWHAGNDGAGSGLDADNLDGVTWGSYKATGHTQINLQASNSHGVRFWNGNDQYKIFMASQSATGAGRQGFEPNSDYNMYFRMDGGTNRGFVFQDGAGNNKAGIDSLGHIRADGIISSNNKQAMNCAHWSASGTSTGAIKIALPGTTSNFSMPVIEVTTYDYSSKAHVIYNISGHNWSTTSYWYNTRVTSEGGPPLSVRLGHDGTTHCIFIGDTNTSWSYGSVTVALKVHPAHYASNQNFTTGWGISQVTSIPSTVSAVTVGKLWHSSNDGAGSGLDADTVDGINGASLLRSDTNDSFTGNELHFPTLDLSISNNNSQNQGNTYFRGSGTHFVLGMNSGNTFYSNYGNSSGQHRIYGNMYHNDTNIVNIWGSGNDGSGSGLDADTLDGLHASSFVTTTALASNDRIYISDTRSADRAPSYYDDRYVQADFNQSVNFGVSGGDSWGTALTVAKWASWNAAHRQEQLIFAGTKLARRVATSDSAWSSAHTIWDSSTDGSGSGLDADTLDGINSSSFLRSDADDSMTGNITFSQPKGLIFANGQQIKDNGGGGLVISSSYQINLNQSTGLTTNSNTIWHAGNDGSGTGLDADLLDGTQKSDLDHAEGFKTWSGITASATQARRFHIARLYGCPAHWDSNWQNIEFHVTAESYESGTLKFRMQGDYGGSGSQANMIKLYLTEVHGPMVGRFRFVLGSPVDAGWDYSGQDTYYVDLFAEAAHYSQWKINAKTYGHPYQTSNPTSGGATTVFYSSPTVSNVSDFNVSHNDTYIRGSKIWNALNDGSGSGLDADTLDGLDLHTGRNNNANKVVRTDSNGYIQAGWINTTSGSAGTTTMDRIYASYDGYIRYYTPANFGSQISSHINYNNLSNKPTIPTNNNQLTNGAGYITNSGGTEAATASTVAKRNSSGDINARLFRSNYATQTSNLNSYADIAFRNDTSDNYIRFVDGTRFVNWLTNHEGSGSGLDADTVDGVQAANIARLNAVTPDGYVQLQRTNNAPLIVDRLGTSGSSGTGYGDQINLKARGTKNGAIAYKIPYGGIGYRYSGDWGLGYYSFSTSRYVQPCDASGAIRDNQVDLGSTSSRFDDVYATNGSIQTSDRNEKQDIQALTTAEQAAAVACKALVRRFRWIDSVEEKGDNARYHFGVIAQDVEAAFTAQGLDAGRYGLFIRTNWWEHENTWYPDEESAPEGAVERSRLGIRYNQLLAFIISAL